MQQVDCKKGFMRGSVQLCSIDETPVQTKLEKSPPITHSYCSGKHLMIFSSKCNRWTIKKDLWREVYVHLYSCAASTKHLLLPDLKDSSIQSQHLLAFFVVVTLTTTLFTFLIFNCAFISRVLESLEMIQQWYESAHFSKSDSNSYEVPHVLFCSQLLVRWKIKHSTVCLCHSIWPFFHFASFFGSSEPFPLPLSFLVLLVPVNPVNVHISLPPSRSLSWGLHWDLPTSLWLKWRNLQQWMLSSNGKIIYLFQILMIPHCVWGEIYSHS